MRARLVRARERSIEEALSLSDALLARAEESRDVWTSATIVRGPAVLLGAHQRASRVLDLTACAQGDVTLLRRGTTGAHVFIGAGGAAVLSLALPSLAALAPDARAATVLNRNVRGWLSGITRYGAIAHYFGREWLSIAKRPAGVMALAQREASDALVIELWIGLAESVALPDALRSARERQCDRWLSKSPASWAECTGQRSVEPDLFERIARRSIERYDTEVALEDDVSLAPFAQSRGCEEDRAWRWAEPTSCAIGWIDAAFTAENAVWIGGDALVSERARAALSRALAGADGRGSDVERCVEHEIALGADTEAWLRCGAALDAVVRSSPL